MEALWQAFLAKYGPYLLTLVGLVLADFLLGVAAALRRNKFDWAVLANFYRTNVVPKLLGWVALSLLTASADNALLGDNASYVTPVVTFGAWGAVVATLVTSIIANGKVVFNPVVVAPVAKAE